VARPSEQTFQLFVAQMFSQGLQALVEAGLLQAPPSLGKALADGAAAWFGHALHQVG
jgi:hypothetical protein